MCNNKYLPALVIIACAIVISTCKKTADNVNNAALAGTWQYAGSTADTMVNGQWPAPTTWYDSTVVQNFAQSLYFGKTDTVFYYYAGINTWSNYQLSGSWLILIGGGITDSFTVKQLTPTTLQFGTQTPVLYNYMNFTKQ